MLVLVWEHYHPAQLGPSKFTPNDISQHEEVMKKNMVRSFTVL